MSLRTFFALRAVWYVLYGYSADEIAAVTRTIAHGDKYASASDTSAVAPICRPIACTTAVTERSYSYPCRLVHRLDIAQVSSALLRKVAAVSALLDPAHGRSPPC